MHEVAARPVRAEADAVVGATEVGLVLGVAGHGAQLLAAVRELALVPVLAGAVLLEGAAHLGLVAVGVLDLGLLLGRGGGAGLGGSLALASVELRAARSY